jgi:hypothetical protein
MALPRRNTCCRCHRMIGPPPRRKRLTATALGWGAPGLTVVPDIEKEHAIEVFKSLIQISIHGFKLLALINGGAAVAALAFYGNLAAKGSRIPDMSSPVALFVAGLVLCALSVFTSYQTQLRLYGESFGRLAHGGHLRWLRVTFALVILSLLAFSAGSIWGVRLLAAIR